MCEPVRSSEVQRVRCVFLCCCVVGCVVETIDGEAEEVFDMGQDASFVVLPTLFKCCCVFRLEQMGWLYEEGRIRLPL